MAALGCRPQGVAFLAEPLPSPREPLLHAARPDDESPGDLVVRQAHDGGERERCALAVFEDGMAAGEEQSQQLVLEASEHLGLGNRDARPRAELREHIHRVAVTLDAPRPTLPVTVGVLRNRHEPRLRGIRET